MSRSSRLMIFGAAVLVLAGLVALGIHTHSGKSTLAAGTHQQAPALSVDVVHPARIEWPRMVTASGSIAPWQEAIVSAQIGGEPIAQVLVDVGDHVKKGQLLARFEDTSVKAALVRFNAQVSQADANLEDARSKAIRAIRLHRTNNISEQDLIAAQSVYKSAKAQLESAKAQLTGEQLMLDYTRVVAPDDGVISSRTATLGKVAAVGSELFRLVRKDRLEWRAELTSDQIITVKPGMAATITLPDGATIKGEVRKLSPTLNDNTRMGIAYVDLNGDDNLARAGMYASGNIILGEQPGIALPSSALISRDGHDYVFVLNASHHVQMKSVTTGRRKGADVEILAGLPPDSPVVKSGGAFLNDGDLVKVVGRGAS